MNKGIVIGIVIGALLVGAFVFWQGDQTEAPVVSHEDTSELEDTSSLPDPEWLIYEDDFLKFPYADTFCGTSWQNGDELELCPEDDGYRTQKVFGGLSASGTSYGLRFNYSYYLSGKGPSFHIRNLTEEEFNELAASSSLAININNKYDHQFLITAYMDAIPDGPIHLYLTQSDNGFWRITSNHIYLYPQYERFLLENIEFK